MLSEEARTCLGQVRGVEEGAGSFMGLIEGLGTVLVTNRPAGISA